MPTRGHRAVFRAKASLALIEIHRKCKTLSCSFRNWKEHRWCVWFPQIKGLKYFSDFFICVIWNISLMFRLKTEKDPRVFETLNEH